MRALCVSLLSTLILGLGLCASMVQSQNHELGADLDDTQRRIDLSRMWILSAEASILAGESLELSQETDERTEDEEPMEGAW